ncbi:hypothetical protein [Microbulbifer sp. A4B17]|uniref:hypothetical protein n=1 Tax=Microbulbifer sp. A4B17 TaxID=359370 RepID=UPI001300279D|nr:hypothetical protein [Microbulbifer sp. A4B17]
MKNLFLLIVLILCSCSSSIDENRLNVEAATESLEHLLSKCAEKGGDFSREVEYVEPIGKRYSYCNQSGAYIKYGGFFVSEYGLYMPAKGVAAVESDGSDPCYKRIRGSVYSYKIRG